MTRIRKNILYNLFGQGLLIIIGFVSVKQIFGKLGEDALGIIFFTSMLNALLCSVLEMGICTTAIREVSAHFKTDPDYIRDFIRTGSSFYWGSCGVLSIAVFFLAPFIVGKWINLKAMDPATAISVLRILGIASFVALPKSFYVSLIRGLQRMEITNFIEVATMAFQQFGTILVLALGGGLFHVVYWLIACYGLRISIYFIAAARLFSLRAVVPGYSLGAIKRNMQFTSRMLFVSITGAIYTQIDKIIISKLMPVGVVGYYGIAYGNVSKGMMLTGAVSQAAFPSFSALFKAGDRKGLLTQYWKLQDMICFITVPIFALIPFAAMPLFSYMFNAEVARMLLVPITLLCIGFYMNGTLNIPHVFTLAVGKPGIAARQHFYDLFVTVPVNAFLIYRYGLNGAGLALIFFYLFRYAYGVPRVCRECLEIPVWRWYLHIMKIGALAGLTYGTAWIVLRVLNNYSLLHLSLAYASATIVFLSASYFLVTNELRTSLWRPLLAFRSSLR